MAIWNRGETVDSGTISVSYYIRYHRDKGEGYQYDWVTEAGDESDMYFADVEDAVNDVKSTYQ
ncbi:hypothetical protein SEA_LIFES_73 [Microbacterium phage Lifes]|nr:hypothetical protein SEA_LIFES_73 [Microbacterium phage Lifes]